MSVFENKKANWINENNQKHQKTSTPTFFDQVNTCRKE